jgi:FKBP-type peptidyl-prolyl cis-trans isomerase
MRSLLRLAPLLVLALACTREQPVQVQEAAETTAAPEPEPVVPAEPERRELADGLVVEVLEHGRGAVARRGGEVVVHYTARVQAAEEPFDSSWSRGVPDRWRLTTQGRPRLIEGLVRGLEGLRAGTRCVLHVPAELAYGSEGRESVGIPPDSTLVWELLLLEARP